MSDMREQFENWVSAPPREFDVERCDEDHDSWAGGYRSYKVQCAWEAWQAAQEEGLVAELKRKLKEAQQNAAFFKSCALSGEVPRDGAEPFPPTAATEPKSGSWKPEPPSPYDASVGGLKKK